MTSPPSDQAEGLARLFHETYERLAPDFGYETRRESAKPWEEVPEANRGLMTAVCGVVLERLFPLRAITAPVTVGREWLQDAEVDPTGVWLVPDNPAHYPRESGGVIVLGPECFADQARTVVCWQGVNFYRARRLALAPLGLTPEGHVDDVGCWCGPATDGSSGLLHTLTQDEPTGADLIADERRRQVDVEGYSLEHDREHGAGKLYHAGWALELGNRGLWPRGWAWKPKNALRDLIRAGALYQASADVASEDWIRDRAAGARDLVAEQIDRLLAEARRVTLGVRS